VFGSIEVEGSKEGVGLDVFFPKGLLGVSLFLGIVSGFLFCFKLSITTIITIIISITQCCKNRPTRPINRRLQAERPWTLERITR
jgi:hypothetical protein